MYIYNTTFGVDPGVEEEFLEWLRNEFVTVSTADGEYFTQPELFRVQSGDPDSNTFALHLRAEDAEDINRWYADHGARLFDHLMRRWGGRVVYFTTTLASHE
ncbi:MAG: DUF4286 family protein [Muribaculaceae bacterium]|nr:DUF4286 family protein [Muribaculaceae bacterium]